jgi:hypothetical protein
MYHLIFRGGNAMKKQLAAALFAIVGASVLLGPVACGGGGSSTGTPIVVQGTMTMGSAIVGGIRFDDSAASVSADGNQKTSAFLGNGMSVKLKGRVNDDRLTGEADVIEVENEIRGSIGSVGTDSFVVLGQTVYVDGSTFFAGGLSFSGGAIGGLSAGNRVEVHGSRDAAGDIRATRVEKLGAGADDEFRGVVTAKTDLASFEIAGTATFTYDGGTLIVGGMDFAIGDLVEVRLSGTYAMRIELEDAEDSEFEPAEGAEIEVEGFVSGYTGLGDTSFSVGEQAVEIGAGTRFEAGVIDDLADDVRVEAEGHVIAGGALSADKIKFKDTIRIEANADKNGEPDALGLNILVTSLTEDKVAGGVGSIAAGDGLKIRGFLNNDGATITVTKIDDIGIVDADKIVLQGIAANPSSTAYTYTVAGVTVNYAGATEIEDEDAAGSAALTLAQFRDKITGGRTAVKAKGSFAAGAFTAHKIEIE